jgi:tRNA pseudouridine13 synthase
MPSTNIALPHWQRAHGKSLFQGLIKQSNSDFDVTETLGFKCSGDGEHDFLWVEKDGANTAWVARLLAKHAGVAERDAGYAGLKDRHAVTRQWFSVRRPTGTGTDWSAFEAEGVRILDTDRHIRKLKRGAHTGNDFRIAIRGAGQNPAQLAERLQTIRERGVPNYFGPQRFGRQGNNLGLATSLFRGKRLSRDKRSIALSSARSFLFNEILSARIAAGTWDQAMAGDALNLDGTGSYFQAETIDDELEGRVRELDVHPTGAMWGDGMPGCSGAAASLELEIAANHCELTRGLEKFRLEPGRRPLRLIVRDLQWELADDVLWLTFGLGRGSFATSFATAVLREIVRLADD